MDIFQDCSNCSSITLGHDFPLFLIILPVSGTLSNRMHGLFVIYFKNRPLNDAREELQRS